MSDSVRDYIQAQITPLLPAGWRIIPNQTIPETLSVTTVVIKHMEMERLPAAPMGALRHQLVVTVVDPSADQVKAENRLDDSVLALVTAFDELPRVIWSGAKKVMVNNYIGWDVSLSVDTAKKATPEPEEEA